MALHFFEFLELFMIDALSIKSAQFQQKRIIRDFFLAGNLIIKIQLLKKKVDHVVRIFYTVAGP